MSGAKSAQCAREYAELMFSLRDCLDAWEHRQLTRDLAYKDAAPILQGLADLGPELDDAAQYVLENHYGLNREARKHEADRYQLLQREIEQAEAGFLGGLCGLMGRESCATALPWSSRGRLSKSQDGNSGQPAADRPPSALQFASGPEQVPRRMGAKPMQDASSYTNASSQALDDTVVVKRTASPRMKRFADLAAVEEIEEERESLPGYRPSDVRNARARDAAEVAVAELRAEFQQAGQATQQQRGRLGLSKVQLLQLYGHWRQGASGDCTEEQPSMFNVTARAKYEAWAWLRGTSQEDAQRKYLEIAHELGIQWD